MLICNQIARMNPQLPGIFTGIKKALLPLRKNSNLGYLVKVGLLSVVIISVVGAALSLSMVALMHPLYEPDLQNNPVADITVLAQPGKVLGLVTGAATNYTGSAPYNNEQATPVSTLLILIIAVAVLVFIGLFIGALNLQAVVDIGLTRLQRMRPLIISSLRRTLPFAGLSLIVTLIVSLGTLLFIVPGIIFGMMFLFAPFIMFEQDVGIIEALRKSKEMTSGYKFQLFIRHFLLAIISTVAFLPLTFLLYLGGQILMILYTAFLTLFTYFYYKNVQDIQLTTPA